MEDRDFKKLIKIVQHKEQVQNIIINGIPQTQEQIITLIVCPKCGRVIQSFGQEVDDLTIIKWCDMNYKQLSEDNSYCPKCGQKLEFHKLDDIYY